MKASDVAPGSRFFSDENEPVSISPGFVISPFFVAKGDSPAEIVNWFGGKPFVIESDIFAKNSPPSEISFEEFSERVARYCV